MLLKSPIQRCVFTSSRSFLICSRLHQINQGSLHNKIPEHNIQSETNRLAKTGKRFWDKGNVFYNEATNRYEVQLDGKTLRTPLGLPLTLPNTKKQLAYLISHEWTNLPSVSVKSSALPLTELAARAIDLESAHKINETENEKVKELIAIDDLKLGLLNYLDTDTCLIFAGVKDCDGLLRQKQDELYIPLIKEYDEFFTKYGKFKGLLKNDESIKLNFLDCEKDGLRGNKQSLKTKEVVMNWLNEISIFELIALEKTVLTTKSFLCGISILRSNVTDPKRMKDVFQINKDTQDKFWYKSVEEIIELGNLETIIQTSRWGEVEDTHDVEQREWLRSLAGAALVSH
ncbi:ATP12 [Candida pseudojiufengensis]|uniref:ATP12 n=1 Tax=Candida pseudojiufengensis TaxID=497109 RepID=UPI002224DF69|nr:ATP12 [Candida pseudojiufengensis]KAI5959563.1 ATP12 [Candida pseudojiufengensis]